MAANLRQLLIQRAARLQGRPALTAPDWGTLSHGAWRNRVEGVALGILAATSPPEAIFSRTGTAWDWAAEVAAACAGLRWDPAAEPVDPAVLGGPRFNDEHGRRPYHDREDSLDAGSAFTGGLSQGELMLRLQRGNRRLGWDHGTVLRLPLAALPTPEGRAALWNLLYAGGHAVLEPAGAAPAKGLRALFRRAPVLQPGEVAWQPETFAGFWD